MGRFEVLGEFEMIIWWFDVVIWFWVERVYLGIDLIYMLGLIVKGKGVMWDDDFYELGCWWGYYNVV